MTDWQQKIEAQIADLRQLERFLSKEYIDVPALSDNADTMQALLDVAVATELWTEADDIRDSLDLAAQLEDALDKLREVDDGANT